MTTPTPDMSFEERVDETIELLLDGFNEMPGPEAGQSKWDIYFDNTLPKAKAAAKVALLTAHQQDIERIIGKDENDELYGGTDIATGAWYRNELRAEQRQRAALPPTTEEGDK